MSNLRRAAQRDANEPDIVRALESVGATVERIVENPFATAEQLILNVREGDFTTTDYYTFLLLDIEKYRQQIHQTRSSIPFM